MKPDNDADVYWEGRDRRGCFSFTSKEDTQGAHSRA